jgi:LCP family protein required for cell wall assembly
MYKYRPILLSLILSVSIVSIACQAINLSSLMASPLISDTQPNSVVLEESTTETTDTAGTVLPLESTQTPGLDTKVNESAILSPNHPPPVPEIELSPGTEVVVLLGTDIESPNTGRTDTIIVAFTNAQKGTVSLLSIPRDLWVYQPGEGMDRINSAFYNGGADLLFQTLEYNLGIRPHHWALAHLDDLILFINDLGGIDVPVSTPLPDDCGGIPTGVVHMDGHTALCYVRSRFSTSDFDRSRRQQEVLRVIFHQFFSLDVIPQLPKWYDTYSQSIQTDLSLLDLLSYVPFVLKIKEHDQVYHFQIDLEDVFPWVIPETGASVLLPDRDKILPLVQSAVDVLTQPPPGSDPPSER